MSRRSIESPLTRKPTHSGSISAAALQTLAGIAASDWLMDPETTETRETTEVMPTPSLTASDTVIATHQTTTTATTPELGKSPAGPPAAKSDVTSELMQLSETLCREYRKSIAELQSAQSAAAAAQSDVLRTLTEVIFQSSACREVSPESLERAFSGVEDRLIARIEAVACAIKATETSSLIRSASGSPVEATLGAASTVNSAPKPASGNARTWSEIRSEMMVAGELVDSMITAKPDHAAARPEATELTSSRHVRVPSQDQTLEIPATVDPETLSDKELREAFREREVFIATLIARVRRQQETATQQFSSEQLRQLVNDLPEELAAKVRHTLKQMDDLARMGELELSLERARIARQINQLEHSRQTIERNARQLGLHLNPDGTIAEPSSQPGRGTSSRRWLGKLGFGQ